MVQDTLTAAEADDLAVLSDRVAPYEAMTHAIPLPSDADLLQHLRESKARPYTKNDAPLMPCRMVGREELIGALAL